MKPDTSLTNPSLSSPFTGPVATLAAVTLTGLSLLIPAPVWAGSEREALARLVHELNALEILVGEAESYGGRGRIRFQYGWLRTDLARVRSGIEDYLNDDREEPREVPPLRGDYRR